MAWIEVHQSVTTKEKTLALCDALDLPEYATVGVLTCFWLWALDNAPDGLLPDASRRIARAIRWDKDPDLLIDAMVDCGWLHRTDQGLEIHDWHDYVGKLLDQREANAKRQREYRERKKQSPPNNDAVTGEFQASQHNEHVTVTLASRNAATRPDQTRPNTTVHNRHDQTEGGMGETTDSKQASGPVVASWEKILGTELPEGNATADWLREYFALYPEDVLPIAGFLRRKRDGGKVDTPLDYLFGIAQKRASRRAAGEPLERESASPARASPNAVPIEHTVVPAAKSRYREL